MDRFEWRRQRKKSRRSEHLLLVVLFLLRWAALPIDDDEFD